MLRQKSCACAQQPLHPREAAFRAAVLTLRVGTTLLVFIGVSANLAFVTSSGAKADILTVDLAWGFAVMIGIYVSGGGSGG